MAGEAASEEAAAVAYDLPVVEGRAPFGGLAGSGVDYALKHLDGRFGHGTAMSFLCSKHPSVSLVQNNPASPETFHASPKERTSY